MSTEPWRSWKPVSHVYVPAPGKETTTPFGSALRRIRVDRRLSQSKLAEKADIDHSTASRLESGARQPSREMVGLLADALDATDAERDELLTAGGFMPVDVGHLIGDPDVALVARLLADPGVSAGRKERAREGFRSIDAMAREA